MRLFMAIQFDNKIIDSLIGFQEKLRGQGVRGNYTKRENLHITLAFIGDYGNQDDVLDAMEQVEFKPLEISLDGVGHFGDLFWVGITDNPELVGYVKRLRHALSENGLPYDKKKFSPHITLIRKCNYKGWQQIPVTEPPKGSMRASRISLMKSERGRNGMVYTEIGSIDLT